MKTERTNNKTDWIVAFFIWGLLFVYLVFRAVWVPVTHDEAATFFHYVRLERFFPTITREGANNHYLNTLLTYLSYKSIGSDLWALRLPNLMGALLFFLNWFRLSLLMPHRIYRWGFFVTVAFALHFLDFFALSRGYGLSMAFFVAALFYTVKWRMYMQLQALLFAALYVVLALASNLSVVLPSIALLMFHLLVAAFAKYYRQVKFYLYLLPEIAAIAVAVLLLFRLMRSGGLYLGTPDGDLVHAVKSWLLLFTGGSSLWGLLTIALTTVFILGVVVYRLFNQRHIYFFSPGFVFDFLLFATLTGAILQHVLFGVYYPEGRTGLYFLPLFIGSLFFAASNLSDRRFSIVLIPFFYLPLSFILHFNFSYANDYKSEVIPERFYYKVAADTANGLPTIGGYHMETTTWAYLNYKHGGRCNLIDWTDFPEEVQDFQLFDVRLYPEILQKYDTVDFESISHLALLKRRSAVSVQLRKAIKIPANKGFINKTFLNLYVTKKDIAGCNFLLDISLNLLSKQRVLHLWIVVQAVNQNGKSVIYKYIPVDWLRDFQTSSTVERIHQTLYTGRIPEGVKSLKIYLWNHDGQFYQVAGGSIMIFQTQTLSDE